MRLCHHVVVVTFLLLLHWRVVALRTAACRLSLWVLLAWVTWIPSLVRDCYCFDFPSNRETVTHTLMTKFLLSCSLLEFFLWNRLYFNCSLPWESVRNHDFNGCVAQRRRTFSCRLVCSSIGKSPALIIRKSWAFMT